jgi:hypothetical protein
MKYELLHLHHFESLFASLNLKTSGSNIIDPPYFRKELLIFLMCSFIKTLIHRLSWTVYQNYQTQISSAPSIVENKEEIMIE